MYARVLGTLGLVLVTAGFAHAQAGVQVTRDGKRNLISKDVGAERWAITLNEDGSVTGNVFQSGGGEPQFVYCTEVSRAGGEVTLDCSGADRCEAAPCPATDWTFIAQVTLPESFFQPPAAGAAAWVSDGLGRVLGSGGSPSGVQITPDQLRTLISKDVGAERWAITRHADDRTVTGNVFTGGTAPPQFVWCEETGQSGDDVSLSCWGADRCQAAPCTPEEWVFIADVTLPIGFFEPPEPGGPTPTPGPGPTPTPGGGPASCGNGVIDPGEECDGTDLDGNDCEVAYGGSDVCTGTLSCTPDCKFDGSACSCPCIDDTDCFFPTSTGLDDFLEMDCTPLFCEAADEQCQLDYECRLGGVCEAGSCVTSTTPTAQICSGLEDPEDPTFPRCLYCEDFDCSGL